MTTVLEEVTDDEITTKHVNKRVDDWERRISALYEQLSKWLPSGWSKISTGSDFITMNEGMMKSHGVKPKRLPIMLIQGPGGAKARLEPRGLWIIGANGRVDLTTNTGHFLIVDRAENFETAKWDFAPFSDRGNAKPLTKELFTEALSA